MKTLYVKDLKKGDVFNGETFVIIESTRLLDKNEKPYYNLVLGDKSGKVSAKIWNDLLIKIDSKILKPEKILAFEGRVDEYKGVIQLVISNIEQVDESELDDFIEKSEYDPEELLKELRNYVNSIQNDSLKKVVSNILQDEELLRKYKYWPAGNTIHHGFRSGLLQHVLEMLTILESMRKFYPNLNYDVMIAGIILHDMGKIEELSGGLSSNYTKKGGLLGHITIGVELLNKYGKDLLDEDTYLHVAHIILSHHGQLQFGSPVVPSTPEAVAVSYIDGLSSKTRAALKIVSELGEEEEFSRPMFFMENARFWKNHNNGNILSESQNNENQISKNEENDDGSQLVISF